MVFIFLKRSFSHRDQLRIKISSFHSDPDDAQDQGTGASVIGSSTSRRSGAPRANELRAWMNAIFDFEPIFFNSLGTT